MVYWLPIVCTIYFIIVEIDWEIENLDVIKVLDLLIILRIFGVENGQRRQISCSTYLERVVAMRKGVFMM